MNLYLIEKEQLVKKLIILKKKLAMQEAIQQYKSVLIINTAQKGGNVH